MGWSPTRRELMLNLHYPPDSDLLRNASARQTKELWSAVGVEKCWRSLSAKRRRSERSLRALIELLHEGTNELWPI